MPANVDFARFNFQVPTAGSAADSAAVTALPLVRSAATNALKSTRLTSLLLRLMVLVATSARMLMRLFISFSPGLFRRTVHPISPAAGSPVDLDRGASRRHNCLEFRQGHRCRGSPPRAEPRPFVSCIDINRQDF